MCGVALCVCVVCLCLSEYVSVVYVMCLCDVYGVYMCVVCDLCGIYCLFPLLFSPLRLYEKHDTLVSVQKL